jgi:nitronate monooxygenase
MKALSPTMISGREIWPLIEGGKGIAISNGMTAGAWAKQGGAGTFSAVNADFYDDDGGIVPIVYHGRTRGERHLELIANAIKGGIAQAKIAHEQACGNGRIHMNVLWEMGGVEPILEGVLSQAKGLIHGVTCGAGMPYRLAEIAARFKVYYLPIVSSARAFNALWRRAYSKVSQWMSAVVYEDPWLAGGHNGLSNQENPASPQDPYPRVLELRQVMRGYDLGHVPIVMAGGVWHLDDWDNWIDNPDLGPIAFQFGTRPLLTQESPISSHWKRHLLTLKPGDVVLNRFSPTGFYSSAVRNGFLTELQDRSHRQITYGDSPTADLTATLAIGQRGRSVHVSPQDSQRAQGWAAQGFTMALKTPNQTLIFVTPEKAAEIRRDQADCMGCLSACQFSNWHQPDGSTGQKPDPRSFCIQKSLQNVSHGGSIEHNFLFAGHGAYRFASDPLYASGHIPTVAELVDHIKRGK